MKQVRVDDYTYGEWFDVLGDTPGEVLIYDHLTKKKVALSTGGNAKYRIKYEDYDTLIHNYYIKLD